MGLVMEKDLGLISGSEHDRELAYLEEDYEQEIYKLADHIRDL
jgi:hypothetical protein